MLCDLTVFYYYREKILTEARGTVRKLEDATWVTEPSMSPVPTLHTAPVSSVNSKQFEATCVSLSLSTLWALGTKHRQLPNLLVPEQTLIPPSLKTSNSFFFFTQCNKSIKYFP